jgi:hypothetical protein
MVVLISANDRVSDGIRLRVLGLDRDHRGELAGTFQNRCLVQKLGSML